MIPLQNVNQAILDFFNGFLNFPTVGTLAPIFADLPIFFLPLFLAGMWVYYGIKNQRKKQEALIFIFLSCVIGLGISILVQQFIHFERPDQHIKNAANLILNKIPEASFPSDHATISIAFLTSLYFWKEKKVFWFFLPFAVLMNLCRVIVGVHWPFDIIVGSIVGIFSSFITYAYCSKIKFVKKINSFIIHLSSLLKL